MEPVQSGSWWRRRGQLWVARLLVAQIVGVLAFVVALLVGERSRITFVALYLPRHPLLVASVVGALAALFLRRRVLVAAEAALSLVVLFGVMGFRLNAASGFRTTGAPVIRVATYNVFFGRLGAAPLLDEIAGWPADIVLLQAARDSFGDRLRERFPDRTVRQDDELILVTRFRVIEVEVPEMLPGQVRPMFVGYLLETPSGPLRVYGIHPYSPRPALMDRDERWDLDVARREAQVKAVVSAAAGHAAATPYVIAGDTNLPHLSAVARKHLGDLRDAFDEVGHGFGYTFPAKLPWMRIDRVLGGQGVRFVGARVAARGASDHRAQLAELELDPSPR